MNRRVPLSLLYCSISMCLTLGLSSPALAQDAAPNRKASVQYYQQAMATYYSGKLTDTIDLCKKAIGADKANKYAFLLMAQAQADDGDNNNADMSYQTALKLDDNFLDCRNSYGMYWLKRSKLPEAQHQFEECLRINPKYPYAHHHLGEVFEKKGNLDHAIEEYDIACVLKPDYWQAKRDLSMAVFARAKQGDLSDALLKLQEASKLVPDNPMIHYRLSQIHCASGRLDDGEAALRRALMCDDKFAAAHWELGKLRYYRGDLDRCLEQIKEAEKVDPHYSEKEGYPKVDPITLKLYTAVCLECKGRMKEAVDTWKEFATMVPSSKDSAKHLAEVEKKLRAAAKEGKKNPAKYNPDEVQALVTKGIGRFDNGDINSAKALFQRALELNPMSFEANQNLGFCLEALGDLKGALAQYQAAEKILPKFDGAVYNIGYVLEKMNMPAEAGLIYQRFHQLNGKQRDSHSPGDFTLPNGEPLKPPGA